jgi:lysophospholipase L1-like esterase
MKLFSRRPKKPYHYSDNLQFHIQTAFHAIYLKTSAIVMFGDSSIQYPQWNELLGRCDVANRGIGQDITAGMVVRLPGIIDMKPRMVFILAGANDIEKKVPPQLTLGNLQAICRELVKNNIDPILHTIPYVGRAYPNQGTNPVIFNLNSSIKRMAESDLIRLINLNEHLSQHGYLKDEYCLFDHCHLNARGYLVWKILIEQVIG